MSEPRQINITLGTAGHVDHGKTALVKLFTGCETDRLKEEKERGLSIELGFAPCTVADVELGIVDVPGHEHFVKTMVAGASGMDGVILVVAADDGVMPQTREHLDIMTLLCVRHGMVALTKIDRTTPERVDEVRGDIETLVRGTFLQGTPIIPVSSVTGEGFMPFLEALTALVHAVTPKGTEGVFRLPVERGFTVKGSGTVLTGIPISGEVHVGDEVVLLPQELTGRINAIQVYGRDGEVARSGQCAALNVRHWDQKLIERGDVVAAPGYFRPEMWYVLRLRLLDHEGLFLKSGSQVKFHTGTSEVLATLYLMEGDVVRANESCLAEVRLEAPLVAGPGDPFIVRTLTPVATVGGGSIIEAVPGRLKRTRPGVVEDLKERAEAATNDRDFVEYCVRRGESPAAKETDLAFRTKVPTARLRDILRELTDAGRLLEVAGGLHAHRETLDRLKTRFARVLADYHRESPASPGMKPAEVREALAVDKPVFDAVTAALMGEGTVVERNRRLSLASHRGSFSPEDQKTVDVIDALFRERLFHPPGMDEVAAAAGSDAKNVGRVVSLLVEHGWLVSVAKDLLFHREAVDRATDVVTEFIGREGRLESVDFKYLLDTTRKYAIPLLDYLDNIGVTRRVGNTRYLKS